MARNSITLLLAALFFAVANAFSPESCTQMFATMKRLGGALPPADYVTGCTEVCDKVKELKTYWSGNAEMTTFACEQGAKFGCVWNGTPPKTLADLGC
mmetsp:Transcript_39371/g.59487  ORF Transcript_39371/g.59487 Transcript_39371/m.59487 type:complete len:98 (+) Transcript_39371:93-386(+)